MTSVCPAHERSGEESSAPSGIFRSQTIAWKDESGGVPLQEQDVC